MNSDLERLEKRKTVCTPEIMARFENADLTEISGNLNGRFGVVSRIWRSIEILYFRLTR